MERRMNRIMKLVFTGCLCLMFVAPATHAQQAQSSDYPRVPYPGKMMMELPTGITPFMRMDQPKHWGFGAAIAKLGDVNGDGYGDFAVSTSSDTTFIFFGGPNFDQEPDAFVLGGGFGIVAGDINGDGYTDIVTTIYNWQWLLDPDGRGLVRVYLHNRTSTMYNETPDVIFTGQTKFSWVGQDANFVQGCDVNGDGKMDLLIVSPNERTTETASKGTVHLYLGKAQPDTVSDFIFKDSHLTGNQSYGEIFRVKDLNDDGFDDIIIEGSTDLGIYNYEIHLGNKDAKFGAPIRDLINQKPIHRAEPFFNVDINADAGLEWFPGSKDPNPPFAWGKRNFMEQTFEPNAVFINPLPDYYMYGTGVYQISSINEHKGKNFEIPWYETFINGLSCWIFQSGPGWQRNANAMFGLTALQDAVGPVPHDLGDVTGDNIPDFALLGPIYTPGHSKVSTVWLYKGDKKLLPTDNIEETNHSSAAFLGVYPNPVTSLSENQVYMRCSLVKPAMLNIYIIDLLGRERLHLTRDIITEGSCQVPVDVSGLGNGQYFIMLDTGKGKEIKPLAILIH
jgi:hypothetical protein